MRIEGAGILIAGGASGLGAATARRLDAAGARVVIAHVDIERGEALAAELGSDARFVRTDVREPGEVEAAVAAAAANEGGLRVAVSCAGVGPAQRIAGRCGPHALEAFARVIAINLVRTFNVLCLAASAMLAQRAGAGRRARRLHHHRPSPRSTGRSARWPTLRPRLGSLGSPSPRRAILPNAGYAS